MSCHSQDTQNDFLVDYKFPVLSVHFFCFFLLIRHTHTHGEFFFLILFLAFSRCRTEFISFFSPFYFAATYCGEVKMFESLEFQFYVAVAILGTVCVLLIFFMAGVCGAISKLKRMDRQRQQEFAKHVALW